MVVEGLIIPFTIGGRIPMRMRMRMVMVVVVRGEVRGGGRVEGWVRNGRSLVMRCIYSPLLNFVGKNN